MAQFLTVRSPLACASRRLRCLLHFEAYLAADEAWMQAYCTDCGEEIAMSVQSHEHGEFGGRAALRYWSALGRCYVWQPCTGELVCDACGAALRGFAYRRPKPPADSKAMDSWMGMMDAYEGAKGVGKGPVDVRALQPKRSDTKHVLPTQLVPGLAAPSMPTPPQRLPGLKADVDASLCLDVSGSLCTMVQEACAGPRASELSQICSSAAGLCSGQAAQGWDVSAAICLEKSMPFCDVVRKHCSAPGVLCPLELVQMCANGK